MNQEQYAVVETIDYNNGITLAESNLAVIGDHAKCVETIAELQQKWSKVAHLNDVSDTYFWVTDKEDIKHSFAVKRPV